MGLKGDRNKDKPKYQRPKAKEQDLHPVVKEWLESNGFEVFPEVQYITGGRVIDVVGVKNRLIIAVEMKLNFNLTVFEQAIFNSNRAHFSYIAVMKPLTGEVKSNTGKISYVSRSNHFAIDIARKYGLGVIEIDMYQYVRNGEYKLRVEPEISKIVYPRKCSFVDPEGVLKQCDSKRKEFQEKNNIAAGTANGGHLTDYKRTIIAVKDYLRTKGPEGADVYEICRNVKTHYGGSEWDSLRNALKNYEYKDICQKKGADGKKLVFYLKEFHGSEKGTLFEEEG